MPTLEGWQITPFYQPAREVGGDFCDFHLLSEGKLGLAIGDATGKGVPAALVMSITCGMLRLAAQSYSSPGEMLRRVNEALLPNIPLNMFVTCFYAILDSKSGSLSPAGGDRFQRQREIHFTRTVIDIKVSTLDTLGGLTVTEITSFGKGGPAQHLHHEQDEWFYVVQGEYVIEVGEERYELGPGDSVLGPRKVAHVWAHVGDGTGRQIAALQPAGEIEAFFDNLATLGSNPEPEVLRRAFGSYGLELIGPPLPIA